MIGSEPQAKAGGGGPAATAPFRLGYRPALDGLRGVAILGVLLAHTRLSSSRSGLIGVDVFFVLSGFLITSLLLQEWDEHGKISLKRFYLRRALRLLPALVVMLAAFVVYHLVVGSHTEALDSATNALVAFFYSENWALVLGFHRPNPLEHAWSLSIEEQFYLLWPLALIWLLRRTSSRGSLFNWLVLALVLALLNRFLLAYLTFNSYRIFYGTDTRADALLLGCIAAVALGSGMIPRHVWAQTALTGWAWLAVLGLACLNWFNRWDYLLDVCLGLFLISLFACSVIVEVTLSPGGALGRLISRPWLAYIGKISYGLYLWHFPIFSELQEKHWRTGKEISMELILSVAAAVASYHLLERPILRYKQKFSRLKQNGK